jgi:hypothetical protein
VEARALIRKFAIRGTPDIIPVFGQSYPIGRRHPVKERRRVSVSWVGLLAER